MTLSAPAAVIERLEAIEDDLASRQNDYEEAALGYFRAERDRKKAHAEAFLKAEGTVAERHAHAAVETALTGAEDEAMYEAQKSVARVLDTRAAIGMAILKSQGRTA